MRGARTERRRTDGCRRGAAGQGCVPAPRPGASGV